MDKTIVFRIIGSNLEYRVGQMICIDGVEGKITSIRSIKALGGGDHELIGRYKPKVNEVDRLLNRFGRSGK